MKLLSSKAEVNVKNVGGKTPLVWAMVTDLPEVFLAYLEHGANLSAEFNGGRNPLVYAIEKGVEEEVPRMLEMSAEATVPGTGGKTPLHAAAEKGLSKVPSIEKKHPPAHAGTRSRVCYPHRS